MRRLAVTATLALATAAFAAPVQGSAPPTCGGRPATLVGTSGDDRLVGTSGRDVVVALAGNDVLKGLGGDDLLCAGAGHDVLRGGPGDDLLDVGPAEYDDPQDLVIYDTARRGVVVDLRAGTATGQGRDRIVATVVRVYGSEHDDELTGFPDQPNFLAGQGGDDRVTGGTGPDVLFGDNDRATKVAGDDVVFGGAGGDSITPGRGDDVASGGSGADYFYARPGEPSGSDQLRGGPDDDWIEDVLGAGDRDRYFGSGGSDGLWLRTRFVRDGKVVHPSGRMRLDGDHTTFGDRPATGTTDSLELVILPVGAWRLFGTTDAELLWAPRGVTDPKRRGVTIRGGGGDDSLIGTPYDDVLVGGEGADRACGRGGDDEIDAEEQAPDPVELCDPR